MSSPESCPISIENEISEILLEMGVPTNIKGYQYLCDAIYMTVHEPNVINSVTKDLYFPVAGKNFTTATRVSDAIGNAIKIVWERGNIVALESYFGYTIEHNLAKPTPSEFIAIVADKVRLKHQRF